MKSILEQFSHLELKSFPKGDVLMHEGDTTLKLLILKEGAVEVLKGDVRVATAHEPGSVFGEMSVLLQIPHTASIRTLADSSFYILENPIEFLKTNPEANLHVGRLLAKRLDSLTRYLVDVKEQFRDQEGHIGMVDDVLETLLHHQPRR